MLRGTRPAVRLQGAAWKGVLTFTVMERAIDAIGQALSIKFAESGCC